MCLPLLPIQTLPLTLSVQGLVSLNIHTGIMVLPKMRIIHLYRINLANERSSTLAQPLRGCVTRLKLDTRMLNPGTKKTVAEVILMLARKYCEE